jgi:branched-chain amino acid transport system substrate-binding protein
MKPSSSRMARRVLASALAGLAFGALAQEQTIRIGLVAPMSGALAVSGKANQKGGQLAVDELNRQQLRIGGQRARFELMAEDDAGDPKQGTAAAQKLVDARVHGVVGHQTSGSAIPASRLYSEAGIPQVSPSVTAPRYTEQGFKTTFRIVAGDASIGDAIATHAVQRLRMKRFAIVDDRSSYGHGIAEEFAKAAVRAGGTIVGREHASDRSSDFSAILTTIKAQQPDAIFVGGMYAMAGPMLRQMKQLGLGAGMLGGDGICDNELLRLAGGAARDDQVFCAASGEIEDDREGRLRDFRKAYRQRFDMDPELVSLYSYDAVKLLADAMRRADSANPETYLPFLARTRDYAGLTGRISFDAKGDLLHPQLALYTFRHGVRAHLATVQMP